MNDPLAQYRKKPIGTVAEPPPPKGPEEYVAFDAKDKVDRLSIRKADLQARTPAYGYLLDVAHDEPGTSFMLYYSFMMIVLVEGRNLRPVIMAIQMGTAEFIQEYDPVRWAKPKDEKAPFIESIQITMEQGGPPTPQSGKPENEKAKGRSLH
ncbi:MAG TPA: hypothetical protein VKQ08_01645 [Cyclobacteriaceae bacterium]|nr:hypothetical protein [Cyclobacteriaceae bacterium]